MSDTHGPPASSEIRSSSRFAESRSEEYLRVILDSIGDAVLATDNERRITWMNPVAERLTGWDERDALGLPIEEVFRIFNEESRQPAVIPVDDVLTTGTIHGLANHTVLVTRDGIERAIADSAAPIRDAAGAIVGVVLVFRDVTDERAAERQVARLLKDLRDIKTALDQHAIVAVTDAAGRITEVNDHFCALSQYSREELVGRTHRVINAGVHPKAFFTDLWDTITRGDTWRGEVCNRAKDGSHYWVQTTIVPFLGDDGRPVQYIAIRTDVTARKATEAALHALTAELERRVEERTAEVERREAELRAFIADVPGAVFVCEVAPPWRMRSVSDAVTDLTGWEPAAFVEGRLNWADLVADEDLTLVDRVVRDAVHRQEPYRLEYRIRHRDGRLRWILEVGRLRPGTEGAAAVLQGSLYDVTSRRWMEGRDQAENHLLTALAERRPLRELLETVLRTIEAEDDTSIGSILLADESGRFLRHGAAPRLPEFYTAAVDGLEIGDGVGSCGTAAWRGELVVVEDIQAHPYWRAYAGLAERAGLRACWSLPIRTVDGRVLGTCAVYHRSPRSPDATDRARIEWASEFARLAIERQRDDAALAESLRFSRATLDALDTPLVVVDADGVILAANRAWQLAARASSVVADVGARYEAICRPVVGFDDADAGRVVRAVRDVTSGVCDTWARECSGSSGRDRRRWVSCRVTRFPGEGPVRAVIAHDDVTRLKEAQRAVERSQGRFETLFEHAPDAIAMIDAAGVIRLVNRRAEAMFGWTRAEMIGRSVDSLFPPDQRARALAILAAASDEDAIGTESGVIRDSLDVCHRDGTTFPVEVSLSRIDMGGRQPVVAATLRDVSERTALEQQLRQSQKMESIGQLAAGIAHDFNNILTVINGSAELALRHAPADTPAQRYLDTIHKAGGKAAWLTGQLLAFSRRQILRPVALDLNAVVVQAEALLRRLLGEHIELVVRLGEDLAAISIDPGQFQQVILNLAVNARDAMPNGGRLTLETRALDPGGVRPCRHGGAVDRRFVMLAVTDTGHGIPDEVRDKVFEPFFTTKPPGKGTGLGLATAYGIVKQTGGELCLTTEMGRGTTFWILLPAVGGDTRAEAAPAPPAPGGSERVLVVDDDDGVRDLVRQILESAGYVVLTAASGDEALDVAAREGARLSLLLTDVVMPGMSGGELAEHFASRYPSVRVLFTTGYTDDALVHHGVTGHGAHLIMKPYSVDDLVRKVREVLDA